MRHRFTVALLVGCAVALLAPLARAETLKPISAKEAEKVITEERDYLTDILWIGIDGYWHEGDWNSSLRLCKEIVQIDPHFVEAYTNGAYLLWNQNRDKEAIAMYEQGIAANPESPDLYFDFGFFYRDRKNYDKAIRFFRQAVKYGAPATQQHMLAATLEEAGKKQEALEEWRNILKRFPDDGVAPRKIERLEKELAK